MGAAYCGRCQRLEVQVKRCHRLWRFLMMVCVPLRNPLLDMVELEQASILQGDRVIGIREEKIYAAHTAGGKAAE